MKSIVKPLIAILLTSMIATESGEFPTETILDDPPSVKNHAENDQNYGHQSQKTTGSIEKYLSIMDCTDNLFVST
jgi:hypothetical protein